MEPVELAQVQEATRSAADSRGTVEARLRSRSSRRKAVAAISVALAATVIYLAISLVLLELFGHQPICKINGPCPRLSPTWSVPASVALTFAVTVVGGRCLPALSRWRTNRGLRRSRRQVLPPR